MEHILPPHRTRRSLFALLASLACLATLTLPRSALGNGADLPPRIVLQGFAKPEDGQLRVVARVPLVLLASFGLPKRGPGYLDLAQIDDKLKQAAAATAQQIELSADGAALAPAVRAARISLLSDKSFASYDAALAHLHAPSLPVDTDLFWNQGFFDVELEYPLRSPEARLSVRVNVAPELGKRLILQLQYLPFAGPPRNYELPGAASIALDPRTQEAAWLFAKAGFIGAFSIDRFVFLLCLIAPFRQLRSLLAAIAVLIALQGLTLTLVAAGIVGESRWIPALFGSSTAAAIVLLAIGNLAAPSLRRRWLIAALIGALGGFGLGHDTVDLLQLAGTHEIASVASFNVGVVLGEIVMLLLGLIALRGFVDRVLGQSLGVVVVSALLGHIAWHWMMDGRQELGHELGHAMEAGFNFASVVAVSWWVLPALIVGGAGVLLPKRFNGDPVPSLLGAPK